MRFAIVILSLFVFGSFVYAQGINEPQPTLPQSPLAIDTAEKSHLFVVELADGRYEQQRGLMFRQSVLPDEGMLFDFKVDIERAFWMRNTLVSLDMLFIRSDGTIHRIAANTTPLSDAGVPSFGPVSAVLELAGGRAAELGIAPGDTVRHQIFGNYKLMKLSKR
ncbi:MAG: DUF192 domain-containing protein [Micropepsaceae bacterium]